MIDLPAIKARIAGARWQPIETAPQCVASSEHDNGRRPVIVTRRPAIGVPPQAIARLTRKGWINGRRNQALWFEPTHWRPLPTDEHDADLAALVAEVERLTAERDAIRADAIEEAAKVCEAERQTFLSPQYATGQPRHHKPTPAPGEAPGASDARAAADAWLDSVSEGFTDTMSPIDIFQVGWNAALSRPSAGAEITEAMREALRFYADRSNWRTVKMNGDPTPSNAEWDGGGRSRAALAARGPA